jgi:hypothetical protein
MHTFCTNTEVLVQNVYIFNICVSTKCMHITPVLVQNVYILHLCVSTKCMHITHVLVQNVNISEV